MRNKDTGNIKRSATKTTRRHSRPSTTTYKIRGGNTRNNKRLHGVSSAKKTKKFKKQQCGPSGNGRKYTCIRDQSICKLKTLWNKRHPDNKIQNGSIRNTWTQLQGKLKNVCNKESCWLKQKFASGGIGNELSVAFAPESPEKWKKNPNEWLSSNDIIAVMKQYEQKYKCFDFIGPSPIDYDTHKMYGECVWNELCHFDLKEQIDSGKTKIGVIFNLDPHYKGGSHWVSLFINIKKASIFYFDSVGRTIPAQIKKFVDMVKRQGLHLPTDKQILFKYDENHPQEHQMGDTECGVYSLYFIIHMLEDKHDEDYFKTHLITDKCVQKFRKVYFNESL